MVETPFSFLGWGQNLRRVDYQAIPLPLDVIFRKKYLTNISFCSLWGCYGVLASLLNPKHFIYVATSPTHSLDNFGVTLI